MTAPHKPLSAEETVELIKEKFIASMVWKSNAIDLYNFDEVQTLVLGNINGFSGLVKDALLSFYQQESALLVEALEFYSERKNMVQTAWIEQHGPDAGQECRKTSIIDYGEVAKKALQTHRLKYPKEKS